MSEFDWTDIHYIRKYLDKDINSPNDSPDPESETLNFSIENDEILNCHISENEILKCLKNNKACSNEGIINEYIKATAHEMIPLYVAFFNFIFNSGALPEWVIRPIYKIRVTQKVQKITGL